MAAFKISKMHRADEENPHDQQTNHHIAALLFIVSRPSLFFAS